MAGEEDDDDDDDGDDSDDDKQSWPTSTLSTSAKIQEINRVDDDVDHFLLGNTKKSYRFNDKATIISYWNHWNFCNVRMKFNRSKMSGLDGIGNI